MNLKRWSGLGCLMLTLGLLLAPSAAHAGGWAVITLVDLPGPAPVGEPVALEFVVRQHGRPDGLMPDLSPVIRATHNGQVVRVEAQAGESPGHYQASLVLPAAGEWEWTITAFTMEIAMPVLTAYEPLPPALRALVENLLLWLGPDAPAASRIHLAAPAERGRDLFMAKGCASCHRHAGVDAHFVSGLGRDLSNYEPNPEFVRVWLRNAATFTSNRQWPMPTLELSDDEINDLIAFLDTGGSSGRP